MYTDPFLKISDCIDGVRIASIEDMIAMKMNVVSRGGRKKDFWDLHMLLTEYPLAEMFALHARRHEWEHNADELLERLTDFRMADEDPDPVCLRGLDWSDIKLDLVDAVEAFAKNQ